MGLHETEWPFIIDLLEHDHKLVWIKHAYQTLVELYNAFATLTVTSTTATVNWVWWWYNYERWKRCLHDI